jgi:RNA 2',3'-cyclic 3'-phosphodiesterase
MRLFVAVTPPAGALDELEAAVAPLRSSCPDLRWTGRPNWHVTLAFLGQVDDAVADKLGPALGEAVAAKPAGLVSLGPAGSFPKDRAWANVLWVDVRDQDGFLARLAATVGEVAGKVGAPPDRQKEYMPHLTLGRCRNAAKVGPLVAKLAGFRGRLWLAGEIQLFQSHLRPQWPEPRYEDLGRWPLAARRVAPA